MGLEILVIMSIIGAFSSGIGGFISALIRIKNKTIVAALYELTAGIMTGIVCFEMLPESIKLSNVLIAVLGVVIGTVLIILIDMFVDKYNLGNKSNGYSHLSLVIIISMGFHNFIEGIAIGSSYRYSISFGFIILLSIILHDIPEGMVVGITSRVDNKERSKTILNTIISGSFTGIGAMFGYILGSINNLYIAICLSFAAGSMLYIVACQLIPNAKKNSNSKNVYIMYIVGILIGVIITKI